MFLVFKRGFRFKFKRGKLIPVAILVNTSAFCSTESGAFRQNSGPSLKTSRLWTGLAAVLSFKICYDLGVAHTQWRALDTTNNQSLVLWKKSAQITIEDWSVERDWEQRIREGFQASKKCSWWLNRARSVDQTIQPLPVEILAKDIKYQPTSIQNNRCTPPNNHLCWLCSLRVSTSYPSQYPTKRPKALSSSNQHINQIRGHGHSNDPTLRWLIDASLCPSHESSSFRFDPHLDHDSQIQCARRTSSNTKMGIKQTDQCIQWWPDHLFHVTKCPLSPF